MLLTISAAYGISLVVVFDEVECLSTHVVVVQPNMPAGVAKAGRETFGLAGILFKR